MRWQTIEHRLPCQIGLKIASLWLICLCVWLMDADVTGRVWWPLVQQFQAIRLVKDVLVLNVLISCASWKMEMAAIVSLYKNTLVISSFCSSALLYSTMMKTFSDSQHALVTSVTAIMPLLYSQPSMQSWVSLLKHRTNRWCKVSGFFWCLGIVEANKEYLAQPCAIKV